MHIKSILLIAFATGITSAKLSSLGTCRVPTSLALSGTLLAGVLTTVPAGVNAVIIPRHGKKNKQSGGKQAKTAAQGTVAAAAGQAAATGTPGGGCNGTVATAGNAPDGQGNNKRAYGLPIYPRHKGQKKTKNAANGACGANQGTAVASGAQGVAGPTGVQAQGAAAATGAGAA